MIIGRGKVPLIRRRVKVVRVDWRWGCLVVPVHAAIDIWAGFVRVRGSPAQKLRHKANVGDGQTEGLDAGKSLFIGKGGHLPTQLVEGLIQIEHPPSLPDIGGSPLGHRSYPTSGLFSGAGGAVGSSIGGRTLGHNWRYLGSLPDSCELIRIRFSKVLPGFFTYWILTQIGAGKASDELLIGHYWRRGWCLLAP